jgi:hypothetical protein
MFFIDGWRIIASGKSRISLALVLFAVLHIPSLTGLEVAVQP